MTDIIASGSAITNIPGQITGYQWKVEIQKVGGNTDPGIWISGTPPSTFDLKARISSFFGPGNLTGQYNVLLWVRNSCNTVAFTGKVQINASPSLGATCFTISTNMSCSASVSGGWQTWPAQVCSSGIRIKGDCSGGILLGGYYRLLVEEYTTANVFVKNIVNTAKMPLNNTNDNVCLDLNFLSNPQGYFYSNASGYKYKISYTVGNECGESQNQPNTAWFVDNGAGCKTGGEEAAADIADATNQSENFSVYPNPASGTLNISGLQINEEILSTVQILSTDGKVLKIPMQLVGNGELKLDVSSLAKGIYTLQLTDGIRRTKPIVIE